MPRRSTPFEDFLIMLAKTFAPMLIAAVMIAGCTDQYGQYGTKQTVGALGGAAAGGLLGSQFGHGSGNLAMTGAGVLLGALLGSEVGKSLDNADRAAAAQAADQAYTAPMGQTIRWNNPNSGHYGTVTPTRDGYADNGDYCREFQQTIVVGGQSQQGYGRACRQPDGSWKIVN